MERETFTVEKKAFIPDEDTAPLENKEFETAGKGHTLNCLLEARKALNMRMLLSVQLRDTKAQEEVQRELEENSREIERFLEDPHAYLAETEGGQDRPQ